MKRKAIFAAGVAMRKSEASAITAPAPQVVLFSAATIGAQLPHVADQLAGEAREARAAARRPSGAAADDLRKRVAAGAEGASCPGQTTARTSSRASSARKVSASSR